VKVESLLAREGRGPIERTGPIPLPGRRPRHSTGRVPVPPTAGAAGVDPDADTEPVAVPAPTVDPAVPRNRDPRPTPPVGIPAPTLSRGRPARPGPPRRASDVPAVVETPGQVASADRPRWWPLRRRARRAPGTVRPGRFGRTSRATVLIALAALAAALGAAGIAVAAWLSSGSGKPGVAAGSALPPTTGAVAGSAVTSGLLTPGATGTAVVTVTNPNPYKVKILTIAPNGTATASGGVGTCTTTGVSFIAAQPGVTLAAKGSTTLTLAGAVAMSTASESGCQGATFTVPVTVGVASTP
jgi:hypothetical protein